MGMVRLSKLFSASHGQVHDPYEDVAYRDVSPRLSHFHIDHRHRLLNER